jgi:hypothetical protein
MTHHFKLHTLTAFSLACAVLAGCGGGDAEAPPPAAAASPPLNVVPGPDTTPPTLTQIANDVSAPTATGRVTFTFLFSEDVGTSFDASDVVVTGGTKDVFLRTTSGAQATLVVIPTANAAGTIEVSVAAGKFNDIAGNANTAGATTQKAYDTRAPAGGGGGGGGTALITFDEATPPTLTDFGVNGAPPLIAADPAGGTNKVLKVFKYALPAPGSEQWAGVTVSTGANTSVPAIPFTAAAKTMTVRTYSPAVGVRVRLKVENAADPNISSETDALTASAGAWETLTFNFANPGLSPPVGGGATSPLDPTKTYNKISIFSDFGIGNGGSGPLPANRVYYYDDITFVGAGGGGGGTAPTNAPTTVIPAGSATIYSEAATAAGFNPFPDWGQATKYVETTIAGNKSLKYTALNYEGIEFTAVDVSSKAKIHFDFWSPDLTSVKVSIISAGKENSFTQALTTGSWNGVDIALSNYTVPNLTAIFQIKLEATGSGTLYVDNIYFWGTAGGGAVSCGTTEPTCAPTTVIPAGSATIYSEASTTAGFNPFPDWGQATKYVEATIAGNKSLKYTALNYEGIEFTAVDVSSKAKIHFDFWSPDLTSVKVSIISAGKENSFTQALTTGSWNGVDIALSNYTVPNLTAIFQIKLEATGSGTLYVDNIYFWGTAGGGAVSCGTTEPTCAPTTVIPAGSATIYSEASTTAGFNPFPDWGQATKYVEATIAGNKSLKYTALNYEGIEFTAVDVSSKGKIHFDFWSPDLTSVKVSIISPGKENSVTQALTTGSWNSVDIALSNYTVPNLTAIFQIKLEATGSGTLYVDNIYFWGTASAGGSNPSAEMGSAGPMTIPVATASDAFGFILTGDAIFANDYIGPIDGLGNHALYSGATSRGPAANGNIGYFNDPAMSTSAQKIEEGGWVSGSIDQQGVPNFFRYFVFTPPGTAFSTSYVGLFVNSLNNGTVNVSPYTSIKMKLWGPAGMYEQPGFNPRIEVVLAGPKVAGCVATGSGGTEIAQTFTASQKIGAGSSYKLPLSGFTVKGVCGSDTNATAVAAVRSALARVVVTVPATSFNFTNANAGSPVTYSTGVNLGPIGFTNN